MVLLTGKVADCCIDPVAVAPDLTEVGPGPRGLTGGTFEIDKLALRTSPPPMASLEYLMFVYSLVLFWKKAISR